MNATSRDYPRRGDVWLADLDPVEGHEQGGTRSVLALSVDRLNANPSRIVVILPVTSRRRGIASHLPVDPPEGGVDRPSVIVCEQPRAISQGRLHRRLGRVD